MTEPRPLVFYSFGPDDPLELCTAQAQGQYLRYYLTDLGAQSVIEEPQHFDRDYLSEFVAFYALSSRGYPNTCRRLHFFSTKVDRQVLRTAAGGDRTAQHMLQESYLGFTVIRPLVGAPFGCTVLKWYPEYQGNRPPRTTTPRRTYKCHLVGIELSVEGLAWEQQDSAVGACATVALWSVLHSSALDEWHSVPTTAQITQFANRTAASGSRTFPSNGLTIGQVREAIKEAGLEPVFFQGDVITPDEPSFSRERFSVTCAALIRSGYPALLYALNDESRLHAVCVVGFRSSAEPAGSVDGVVLADANLKYVYLHDDNLGPNVRFALEVKDEHGTEVLILKPSSPEPLATGEERTAAPCASYGNLRPAYLVAAVPSDLRVSPDALHKQSLELADEAYYWLKVSYPIIPPEVFARTRFLQTTNYVEKELPRVLGRRRRTLASARLALAEKVAPMSRILGLVRLETDGQVIADVLFDTTEGDTNLSPFCTVAFSKTFLRILKMTSDIEPWPGGVIINAAG